MDPLKCQVRFGSSVSQSSPMPFDDIPTTLNRAPVSSYFTHGFLPAKPAASRLPDTWKSWEDMLSQAIIRLGSNTILTLKGTQASAEWRASVREMPVLPIEPLLSDTSNLLRARQVLTFLLHFYIHTQQKTSAPIRIPPPLSIPLRDVSRHLGLPPICTYSDTIYYNYSYSMQEAHPVNLKIHCAFTSTQDEEHFYRIQVLIEHCGAVAMRLMSRVIEEVSTPSQSTVSSVTALLKELVAVIDDINRHLNQVRNGCDPSVFYNEVRHWFPGAKLIFEGTQLGGKEEVEEWAGSSAAQSTTIQALDAFLGIDELTHNPDVELEMQKDGKMVSFLTRMRMYIPADHRVVLNNLSVFGRSLRAFIIANSSPESPSTALVAYNSVITSLKNFRTSHIRVATVYIVNQRKEAKSVGTGGTELVPFLRSVRDQTGRGMV